MPAWLAMLPFLMPVPEPEKPGRDMPHRGSLHRAACGASINGTCLARNTGGAGGSGGNAVNNYYFNFGGAQGGPGGDGGSVGQGRPSGGGGGRYPGSAAGRWAVGSAANCGVPAKSYSLSVSGGSIVWRNGVGDTDVEAVVFSGDGGFGTRTTRSMHPSGGGYPPGTSWTYTSVGPGRMQVTRGGGGSFMLSRC